MSEYPQNSAGQEEEFKNQIGYNKSKQISSISVSPGTKIQGNKNQASENEEDMNNLLDDVSVISTEIEKVP